MRKNMEKIAVVALVCVTLIFVLMAVLYATNVIKVTDNADNTVTVVVLCVLSALYVGLSVYLLIVNFSEAVNVKKILLFYDTKGATHTSSKVITNIVRGCVKEFPKLKFVKVTLRMDDKMDLVANIKLNATDAEDIHTYVPQLRQLLEQSFLDALSLEFSVIDIEVVKLSKKFTPTDTEVETARQVNDDEQPQTEQVTSTEQTEQTAQPEFEEQVTVEEGETDHKQEDIAAGETAENA